MGITWVLGIGIKKLRKLQVTKWNGKFRLPTEVKFNLINNYNRISLPGLILVYKSTLTLDAHI